MANSAGNDNSDQDGDSKEKDGDDDDDDDNAADDKSGKAPVKKRMASETEISPKSYPVDDLLLVCNCNSIVTKFEIISIIFIFFAFRIGRNPKSQRIFEIAVTSMKFCT